MIVSLPSRNQLLTWISQLTNNNVERLQHLSDGIAFCQIFDKMYPKMINLAKLKRDSKIPLEKERNFRILLNAINQMGISLSINIVDLSHGKVTAILELLQWFYKQYKNPIARHTAGQENDQRFSEPRMIKTYVGNLIDRQKTCQKEVKPPRSQISQSRRSLDVKLIHKNVFETEKSRSIRSKTVHQSQHKQTANKKENPSKVKSIVFSQEKFEQRCSQKKQSMQKQLSQKVNKMSQKKSEIKSQKISEKEERKVLQVLSKALNAQKPRLQNTLIRVTQAVLQGNPQLEEKIIRIIDSEGKKEYAPLRQEISPDHQVRNLLDSYRNTSEICQNDTLDDLGPQNGQFIDASLNEAPKIHGQNMMNSIDGSPLPISIKKATDQDKKQTVKKSIMKPEKDSAHKSFLLKSIKSNHISASKAEQTKIIPQIQQDSLINQNIEHNFISREPQKCYLFDPHNQVEKLANPQSYVTEKKPSISKEGKPQENRRQVQSENFTISFSKEDKNVWKQNQSFGPNQNM